MEVRAGKWVRSIVCCVMAATLLVPASSALAGTGNDVSQSGSNFSYTGGSGSGGTNKYATYDGGVKISFLLISADGKSHYKPEKSTEKPLLRDQTPTSLASGAVPSGYKTGSNDGEDYKWGWGTLACEDYMEMESSNAVMTAASEKFTPFM